jgi:hypothetical protein
MNLLMANPDLPTPDYEQGGCSEKHGNEGYHCEAPHILDPLIQFT